MGGKKLFTGVHQAIASGTLMYNKSSEYFYKEKL
ncbi:hypothetical protein BHECKSOX_701 [Bathymodiolus heckerae thiotrophic gill symbiont]|nr:hypothetical protein BHECKSOX_701 [Bathymodiolus heckerae thiotrophic gill symbiont]